MSSILEGKIIDLGLVPQDFFTTEKLPIKKRLLGIENMVCFSAWERGYPHYYCVEFQGCNSIDEF